MLRTFNFQIYNECHGLHGHDYPQIMVPLQEPLRIEIDNLEYDVSSQELCLVPAHILHQCHFHSSLLVINIPRDMLEKKDSGLLTYPLVVPLRKQVTQLVELIQAELQQNPQSRAVDYLYKYLYTKLIENCSAPSIRYIQEHYNEQLTTSQLAALENYNATYYNDWFKQQTGLSPMLYLRHVRINKAKELLADSSFSIMEIALMVGYSSNATLTRAFHSLTGMTPKDYRACPCFKRMA